MDTNLLPSDRPLPAVHSAALELHVLAIRWFEAKKLTNLEVTSIRRATGRVARSIEVAVDSFRRKLHLRIAQETIARCRSLFRQLYVEEQLDGGFFADVLSRLSQIAAGVEQLMTTAIEKWLSLHLDPETEAPPAERERGYLRQFRERIQAVVDSLRSAPPEKPGEPPDPEPDSTT